MATQAKQGGEVGANGEWYKGGQFIAQTDMPKGAPKPKKKSKVEIAPFVWEYPEAGMISVWGRIGAYAFNGWEEYKTKAKINPNFADTPEAKMLEKWNNGERWMHFEDMRAMGVFVPDRMIP